MQQHLKVKELVSAAYEAAQSLPPDSSRLMREVATRLNVTFIVLMEAMDQRAALMADNQQLRGEKTE